MRRFSTAVSKFRLSIGVAGADKKRWPKKQAHVITTELDDPRQCGEDAFGVFRSQIHHHQRVCLGVFDGVGGWAEQGVDAGIVSHMVAKYVQQHFTQHPNTPAFDLLRKAQADLYADSRKNLDLMGSTTACIATVQEQENNLLLDVANIGDSGAFVFRAGKLVWNSRDTSIAAGTPHQIAAIPPRLASMGYFSSNAETDASTDQFSLQVHDWLLVVTDGITDNINLKVSGALLKLNEKPPPSEVALALLRTCFVNARKIDDTTAVVLHVNSA